MLVMASSKILAMSPMSSAREPVGSSPKSRILLQLFGAGGAGGVCAIEDQHAAIGGFDEDVDALVEDLRILDEVDLLGRQMLARLKRRDSSREDDEGC